MSPILVILFIIGALLLLFRPRRYPYQPPGPTCYPLIGSLYAMAGNPAHLHVTLTNLAKKYGPVFRLQFAYTPIVVITDANIIREAAEGMDSPIFLRFRSETIHQINKEHSILFPGTRDDWKLVRRVAHPINRSMPGGLSVPEAITQEIAKFTATLDKSKNKEINLHPLLDFFSRNCLLKITMRKSWDFNTENAEEQELTKAINGAMVTATSMFDFIPSLQFLASGRRKACSAHNDKIEEFLIKEVRKRERACKSEDTAQDFLDVLLLERKQNPQFTEESLLCLFRTLMFAGTLTTSDALDWMLLYLSVHPDMQDKCHKEISAKLQGRAPVMDDQNDMPYLDAVLKETLRIRPTAPLSMPRMADRDCIIGNYHVKKGSIVMLNLYGVGTSEKNFKNAHQFDPDRWLRDPSLSAASLLTFGHGPNTCLGTPIAKQELFLAAATLLQRYKFTVGPTSDAPDFTGEFLVGPFKPKSWKTLISMR